MNHLLFLKHLNHLYGLNEFVIICRSLIALVLQITAGGAYIEFNLDRYLNHL